MGLHRNNRYRLNLITAPATEPVTLAEAKDQLRIDGTDDDTILTAFIVASRQWAERYTRRALITQTWQAFYDRLSKHHRISLDDSGISERYDPLGIHASSSSLFGQRSIEIPLSPLQSITHIKTFADDDTETIFAVSNYQVSVYDGDNPPAGRVTLRDGATIPFITRNADGIEIQFVAGYGDAADVPQQIRRAILVGVAFLYEHRGDCEGDKAGMPRVAELLLDPYRLLKL